MNLFAGFDCGGTKTTCVIANETGNILAEGVGGPSNYLSCGFNTAFTSIKDSAGMALSDAGIAGRTFYSVHFGSAAVELFSEQQSAKDFFIKCLPAVNTSFNNDAYTIYYGTTFGKQGIITVAGTGAVTYGIRKDDTWVKADGWGYLIGDKGSGYSIGNKAIRYAIKSFEGAANYKQFEDAILKHFSISSMRELTRVIYGELTMSRLKIASAANCVFALYFEGNKAAARILEDAADAIVASVLKVYKDMAISDPEVNVILSGSILKENEPVSELVIKKLAKADMCNFKVKWPRITPAAAALLLSYQVNDGINYNAAVDRILCKYGISGNEGK